MKFSTILFATALPVLAMAQPASLQASADVAAPQRRLRGQFEKWYRDINDIGEGDSATHAKHWLYNYNKPIKGANRVELAELLAKQVEEGYVSLADAHIVAQQYIHASDTTWNAEASDRLRQILNSKVPVAQPAAAAPAQPSTPAQPVAPGAPSTPILYQTIPNASVPEKPCTT